MDHTQLELDLQVDGTASQTRDEPKQSAVIFCIESARKHKWQLSLNSAYEEIIASVEHIEINNLLYK